MGRRFLMTTWGSLGDLHPFLAVSLELRQRGHEVTIATSEMHRSRVEGAGVGFHPVRPDLRRFYSEPELLRRILDPVSGTEFVIRELMMAHLEQTYEDLVEASQGKDFMVNHTDGAYVLPLVAEKLRLPWVSIALHPFAFLSIHDPPAVPLDVRPRRPEGFRDWEYALLLWSLREKTRAWFRPVDELRNRLGLKPAACHPLFPGAFSPLGTLAWFSPLLAAPRPDWPSRTRITGFPFYEGRQTDQELDPRLSEFLEKGERPIVFTLGTSAVLFPGDFFQNSLTAARILGRRAILLVGERAQSAEWSSLPDTFFVADYVPHSALLPHAAVVVHHGGIGTTGQVLRAGLPMLVVPYIVDQPDNAARVRKLGIARVLYPKEYTAQRAQEELTHLLTDASYSERAAEVGRKIRAEQGVSDACDALEELAAAA
jgi:rhamnosyltransferase subunit B